ncbi:MAG TPA: thioredoxin family protein [Lacipirellulaceae bacterium]
MIGRCLLTAMVMLGPAAIQAEEAVEQPAAQERAGERLLNALGSPPQGNVHSIAYGLELKLMSEGEEAEQIASQLLEVTRQVVIDDRAADFIETLAKDKPTLAAQLLLQVVRGGQQIQGRNDAAIVVGRLVVEDEKYDPTMVLAQMQILPEGYFAGHIGDDKRPLSFRAHGYEALDVPLAAEEGRDAGGVIVLDEVVLRPIADERRATLRGRVVLDASSDASGVTVTLDVAMPPVNTPSGGYSGRMAWPEGIKAEVDESGAFTAEGLSPTKYNVLVTADGHVQKFQPVTLKPGETTDAGDVRLFASDLGFYIGHEAPETPELAWETDFKAALERSKKENRPLMVMMTATWCGPCKMLESETLADPWIRHFLSNFVVVKAYEDRDVEKTYGLNGYPTLVFCDSSGEQVHKTVGYQPAFAFASQCAKAIKGLESELPEELQVLIEKKIIQVE